MAPLHILIVDDSALVTDALRILFEANGYRVSVAGSVASAAARAVADPADVMLLDLTLPDGDGLATLARLRTEGAPSPATIALTGHDDDVIRERCLAAGCRAVLVKPAPTQQLLALVRSLETARP